MNDQDTKDTERFMKALFPRLDEQNLADIVGLRPGGGTYGRAPYDAISDIVELAETFGDKCNLYFRLSTCKPPKNESLKGFGARPNLASTATLWADVDVDEDKVFTTKQEALEAIKNFEPTPSIIVNSGGGFHVYWLLREPVFFGKWKGEHKGEMDRVEGCNRGIMERLPSDNCWDATRILRIPGTFNLKKEKARPVELVKFDDSIRYGLDQLAELLYEPYSQREQQPRQRPATEDGNHASIFSTTKVDGRKALERAIGRGLSKRAQGLIAAGDASQDFKGDRSRMCASVVMSLLRVETPYDDILAVFKNFPVGERYGESGKGWLARVILSAEAQLDPDYEPMKSTKPPPPIPSTPGMWAWRHFNRMLGLIALLRREAPLTKKAIGKKLGRSRSTVDVYIKAGLGTGWVEKIAPIKGARGLPAARYQLSDAAPTARERGKVMAGLANYARSSCLQGGDSARPLPKTVSPR